MKSLRVVPTFLSFCAASFNKRAALQHLQHLHHHYQQLTTSAASKMSNEIQIRLVQAEDCERVLDFMRKHYYPKEPLTLGAEPKQQDLADEQFHMSLIAHATIVMAVLAKSEEQLVGIELAAPKDETEAAQLFKEAERLAPSKWGDIVKLLACAERDSNVYARYGVSKALHAHALAVDSRFHGQALGKRLTQELMLLGQKHGYPLFTVDCTSVYSVQLCEEIGMECVNTVRYDEYLNEKGVPVFRPPPPHDSMKTYAIRLNCE